MYRKVVCEIHTYLKKSYIENLALSDNAIGAYVAMRKIHFSLEKSTYYVSVNLLLHELFGNNCYTRNDRLNIVNGLSDLIKYKIVMTVENISKTEWVLDLSSMVIDKSNNPDDNFVSIYSEEIFRIMNCISNNGKRNIQKLSLLRYFINLIGSINYTEGVYSDTSNKQYTNFVGYMSQKYLCSITNISINTILRFNEILENEKLIYIHRHKSSKVNEFGERRAITNHYGRYKDKGFIDEFALDYEKKLGITDKLTKKQSNHHKSLANKYRELTYGKGENYSNALIREIYFYIHKCNIEIKKELKNRNVNAQFSNKDLKYIKNLELKLRDESIFDKYTFLFERTK